MTDAEARGRTDAAGSARLTWTIGGGMLVAYAVLQLLVSAAPGLQVPPYASELLWAGALVILAFGVRRQGGIVGRNPFGITVLVIAALLPLAADLAMHAAMASVDRSAPDLLVFGSAQYTQPSDADLAVMSTVGQVTAVLSIVVPVLVGVVIGRARVLPPRWRWLPLIVLALLPALQVLGMLFVATPGGDQLITVLIPIQQTVATLSTLGILLLGILAIVFARRAAGPADETVQVYPPAA
ncbi:hypothetical protein [Microbacterium candidum]|uniref:Uncharacterized protein n=1 Tax=Microbacterium candidum TaxID=3041922 RepID=A0ABT7MX16_9MICO|nr:hypothetical protein [Microbacterium sp. ASV49]MDL9978976.1 hypothetical protein [Microbacterium sp. ASV49]